MNFAMSKPTMEKLGFIIMGSLALIGLGLFLNSVLFTPFDADFWSPYSAAKASRLYGWQYLYDLVHQQMTLPSDVPSWHVAYRSPPLLAWIVYPLTFLPIMPAYFIWVILSIISWGVTIYVLAEPTFKARVFWSLACIGFFPLIFSLRVGQFDFIDVLGLSLCIYLIRKKQPYLAGLALALMGVKPHLMIFIPVLFLLIRQWRVVLGFTLAGILHVLISVAILGKVGLLYAKQSFELAYNDPTPPYSIPAWLGHNYVSYILIAVVILVSAAIILKTKQHQVEMAASLGLIVSLLATPYLHLQDISLILVLLMLMISVYGNEARVWAVGAYSVGMLAFALNVLLPIALLATLGWLLILKYRFIFTRPAQPEVYIK